jgi:5,6,7,8-tetrahydromethanopterin hydro-lyase
MCLIVSVFIHWEAEDDQKIFDFNHAATKHAIVRALGNSRPWTPCSARRRPPAIPSLRASRPRRTAELA